VGAARPDPGERPRALRADLDLAAPLEYPYLFAEHPNLGKPRPEIRDGYYSYLPGSHVVFYLVRQGGIDIIGILHQRMDVLSYFSGGKEG